MHSIEQDLRKAKEKKINKVEKNNQVVGGIFRGSIQCFVKEDRQGQILVWQDWKLEMNNDEFDWIFECDTKYKNTMLEFMSNEEKLLDAASKLLDLIDSIEATNFL